MLGYRFGPPKKGIQSFPTLTEQESWKRLRFKAAQNPKTPKCLRPQFGRTRNGAGKQPSYGASFLHAARGKISKSPNMFLTVTGIRGKRPFTNPQALNDTQYTEVFIKHRWSNRKGTGNKLRPPGGRRPYNDRLFSLANHNLKILTENTV